VFLPGVNPRIVGTLAMEAHALIEAGAMAEPARAPPGSVGDGVGLFQEHLTDTDAAKIRVLAPTTPPDDDDDASSSRRVHRGTCPRPDPRTPALPT
jgi:hypothetical protein